MNPIVRNILAVIAGLLIGGAVNMGIITLSPHIIPPPPGTDFTTAENIVKYMPMMQPRHFIMPFLAHALGSFVGALVAALLAANNHMRLALGIGIFSLIGGIGAVYMIPAPLWFDIIDLVGTYIPMAYIAGKIATKGN